MKNCHVGVINPIAPIGDRVPTTTVEMPVILKVEYEPVENPGADRKYPVDIKGVKLVRPLSIGQIMELQRIIHEAENG